MIDWLLIVLDLLIMLHFIHWGTQLNFKYYLYRIIAFIYLNNMYFYTLYFSTNKHIIITNIVWSQVGSDAYCIPLISNLTWNSQLTLVIMSGPLEKVITMHTLPTHVYAHIVCSIWYEYCTIWSVIRG